MKNVALLLATALSLSACGSDKKDATAAAEAPVKVDANQCPDLNGVWQLFENGQLDSSERIEINSRREGDRIIYHTPSGQEFEPNGVEILTDADKQIYSSAVCRDQTLVLTSRGENGKATFEITVLSATDIRAVESSPEGTKDQVFRKAE